MIIKKAYDGIASSNILRIAIGISLLVILLPGLANALGTSPPNYITQWGSNGSGDGQLNFPESVAIDSSGNVYIADSGNNRIQKFSSDGTFITKWGSLGNGTGQFHEPSGIAVDSSGNVYVADFSNDRIQKFSSTGTFITKWGSPGSGDGQFATPYGVAVDSSGNVYVSDENHRIQKFTSTGTFITKWGSVPWGNGDGQFATPIGIAVDYSGNIYVADMENKRVQKFTSTGTFITKWGSAIVNVSDINIDGKFGFVIGIAVDSSGNVYVSDSCGACRGANGSGSNHIQEFSSTGTFITKFGSRGSGDGQFNFNVYSNTIAVDSSGNIYVADTGNNRIQKFGNLAATPQPTFNISGFKINNSNGIGVQGWNITLMNSTMQKSILTSADGSYKFTNLVNGTYNVTEETQVGWTNVSPMPQQVIINGADMPNINFTNSPVPVILVHGLMEYKDPTKDPNAYDWANVMRVGFITQAPSLAVEIFNYEGVNHDINESAKMLEEKIKEVKIKYNSLSS
jgi:DNA-binding beta-propeller fold protein YncE